MTQKLLNFIYPFRTTKQRHTPDKAVRSMAKHSQHRQAVRFNRKISLAIKKKTSYR